MNQNNNNISIEYKDAIGIISLNRRPINALSVDFLKSIKEAFLELNSNNNIRVIILKSNLTNFSAGADLKERSIMKQSHSYVALDSFKDCFKIIQDSSKITICCISGYCLGGGAEMSLCFDFRIGSPDSIVGFPEVSIGIIPGAGGTQRLQRIIGYSNAKYWILTAKKINAKEALACNFFNRIVDNDKLLSEALYISSMILENSPIGVKCAKKAIDKGFELPLKDGLIYEREQYDIAVNTKDRLEALDAFINKRKPKWSNK